jgi:heptosyltransferase-2
MIKRILIIRPDKIGDLILTLPMAAVIKESMPDAHVTFLVREYTAPLLALYPDADEILLYDPTWSLKKNTRILRSSKADAVFFFGSKFKLTIAAFLARIPLRIGRAYWWYSFLYNKKIYEHRKTAERNEAEYNVRMLKAIGIETTSTPIPQLLSTLLPKNLIEVDDYVVLHLTTGGSAPTWDENKFVEIAKWLSQEKKYSIVLTGIPEDNEFLFRIASRMKHSSCDVHILTQSDLLQLASVLDKAKIVISGSTGPGHIAAALGTPTIGLFPQVVPLSRERWGFRGKKVINLSPLIRPKTECPYCKDCICIIEITTMQVIEAIENLNI